MKSKWFHLKHEAVVLRKSGASIREIESLLGVARSTLSGWFKKIQLSKVHKERLQVKARLSLVKARKEAVKWHNFQKENRKKQAFNEACSTFNKLVFSQETQELALAMLYLGEGAKKSGYTALGVRMLRF